MNCHCSRANDHSASRDEQHDASARPCSLLKRGLVCFAQGRVSRRCTTEQHAELVTHELTNADQRIRDGSLLVMLLNIQRWLIVFFVSARRHGGHSLGGAVLSTGAKDDVELVAVVQGHILCARRDGRPLHVFVLHAFGRVVYSTLVRCSCPQSCAARTKRHR